MGKEVYVSLDFIQNKEITPDALRIYMYLGINEDRGGIYLVEVQDVLGLSRYKVNKNIELLEEQGFVKREGKKVKMTGGNQNEK